MVKLTIFFMEFNRKGKELVHKGKIKDCTRKEKVEGKEAISSKINRGIKLFQKGNGEVHVPMLHLPPFLIIRATKSVRRKETSVCRGSFCKWLMRCTPLIRYYLLQDNVIFPHVGRCDCRIYYWEWSLFNLYS